MPIMMRRRIPGLGAAGALSAALLALATLSPAPALADDPRVQNWLEKPGYSGSFDNWGDSLIGWWTENLGEGSGEPDVEVFDSGHYAERDRDAGIVAMDDACWVPDGNVVDGRPEYIRHDRALDGIGEPSAVTAATDDDLQTALDCLGMADIGGERVGSADAAGAFAIVAAAASTGTLWRRRR